MTKPKDFTYSELKKLLNSFEYKEIKRGKTAGSRVAFFNSETKHIIKLHKPHPRSILKRYQLDEVEEKLKNSGLI
ncbi:MAG: type II toxin-antitoxin system HicA family toxin [Candidatus Anammoxibacter sp.]